MFELLFQGQAHDVPIGLTVTNSTDKDWVNVPTATPGTNGAPPVVTWTPTLMTASAPQIVSGDYAGGSGTPSYNASVAMNYSGNMDVAYTNQPLTTAGFATTGSNVSVEQLPELTDTAGPQIVGWSDSNGVDLLTGGTAVGVTPKYFAVTFNEPMLADDPTVTRTAFITRTAIRSTTATAS